jgi:8-oxo-dGTP pyrophosphatase MutT (NUDIX family)
MGQRGRGHTFMPDKYVFPGGRVDLADNKAPASRELQPDQAALVAIGTTRNPRAFALAAVRETFEETGLLVGAKPKAGLRRSNGADGWRDYLSTGVTPDLHHLMYLARAITPPYRPKRFDARFFLAYAEEVLVSDDVVVDGAELQDIRWVELDEALTLDLPNVTRFVLGEVAARLAEDGTPAGPPFLRWTRRGHRMDRLG